MQKQRSSQPAAAAARSPPAAAALRSSAASSFAFTCKAGLKAGLQAGNAPGMYASTHKRGGMLTCCRTSGTRVTDMPNYKMPVNWYVHSLQGKSCHLAGHWACKSLGTHFAARGGVYGQGVLRCARLRCALRWLLGFWLRAPISACAAALSYRPRPTCAAPHYVRHPSFQTALSSAQGAWWALQTA